MPRPLRTSCDRCHSQKLKCPKQMGSATCTRCAKAGALCLFSPAGPSGRRRPLATPTYENDLAFPSDLGSLDMSLDWTSLDLAEPLAISPQTQITQITPSQATETQPSDPRAVCVQQLSSLALDIDRAYNLIPSRPNIHVPKDGPAHDLMALWSAKYSQSQCLEQLFTSAQQLVAIYPSTLDIIFQVSEVEGCHDPDCLHRQELPVLVEDQLRGLKGVYEADRLDAFVFNLLMTCHMRIVDVLDLLLVHVRICATVTLATPSLKEPKLDIPELKVGNFVASPESSSSMQAMLLVHIAPLLVDRAKQLSERAAEALKDGQSTRQTSMLKLQCEVLVEAGESKVLALNKVRDALVKVGYMR
ncbi:hypothetical protein SCUP515_13034 [Seiridium cupressi]